MNASHPIDEELSAFLDDEADAGIAAHVDGCAVCRARVDQLQEAALAIGAPVDPQPDDVKRRAAAYAAANGPARSDEWLPTGVARIPSRQRRAPSWLLPAAAAVAALLLAVPLLAGLGTFGGEGGSKKTSAAIGASATTTAPFAGDQVAEATTTTAAGAFTAGAAAAAPAPPFTVGTDLGAVTTVSDLQARVNSQFGARAAEKRTAATTAEQSAPASGTTAAPCTSNADAAAGPGRTEIYRATLRWQGQAATVFGYRRGSEPLFLVVVANGSCAVLVTTNASA